MPKKIKWEDSGFLTGKLKIGFRLMDRLETEQQKRVIHRRPSGSFGLGEGPQEPEEQPWTRPYRFCLLHQERFDNVCSGDGQEHFPRHFKVGLGERFLYEVNLGAPEWGYIEREDSDD